MSTHNQDYVYLLSVIESITKPRNESKSEPSRALQNPSIATPGAKYPASRNNRALMIKPNNPNVKRFIGSVINVTSGRIKILINAIITQISNALCRLPTSIPGTSQPTNITASAYKIHLKSKIIVFSFLYCSHGLQGFSCLQISKFSQSIIFIASPSFA